MKKEKVFFVRKTGIYPGFDGWQINNGVNAHQQDVLNERFLIFLTMR